MKKEAIYEGAERWFNLERRPWTLIQNRQSVLVSRNYADSDDSGLNRNVATTSTFLAYGLASRSRAYLVYQCADTIEIDELQEHRAKFPVLNDFESSNSNSWIPIRAEVLSFAKGVLNDNLENKDFFCASENFFKRLQLNAITGRRPFASKKGYIGLAPTSAEAVDWIAFLPGSAVPFCIRGMVPTRVFVGDGSRGMDTVEGVWSESYILLGEVCVHGLMHGELFHVDGNAVPESIAFLL